VSIQTELRSTEGRAGSSRDIKIVTPITNAAAATSSNTFLRHFRWRYPIRGMSIREPSAGTEKLGSAFFFGSTQIVTVRSFELDAWAPQLVVHKKRLLANRIGQ
jgi:hypothetical protein